MDWASLPWDKVFVVITVLIAGIGIAFGVVAPAVGQAIVAGKAMNAIARQPEAGDAVNRALILSLAMLESLAIYVLVIVLIILFRNPLLEYLVS